MGLGDVFQGALAGISKSLPQITEFVIQRDLLRQQEKAAERVARRAQLPLGEPGGGILPPLPLPVPTGGNGMNGIVRTQGGLGGMVQRFTTEAGLCPTMFRPTASTMRPASVVVIPHPETGAPTFFGNLGKPLLFSRDLSAARKVNRLARRARRARGGR